MTPKKKPGPVPVEKKTARKSAAKKTAKKRHRASRAGRFKSEGRQAIKERTRLPRKTNTPAKALAADLAVQEAPIGAQVLEDLLAGATFASIRERTGLSWHQIQRMIANFARYSPEEHRAMVEGMRGFMGSLVLDDLMHWRPVTRDPGTTTIVAGEETVEVRDIELQKVAAGLYHNAKDSVIKIYGLATQTLEISEVSTRAPMTDEELRAKAMSNPEVAAAAAAIGLLGTSPTSNSA